MHLLAVRFKDCITALFKLDADTKSPLVPAVEHLGVMRLNELQYALESFELLVPQQMKILGSGGVERSTHKAIQSIVRRAGRQVLGILVAGVSELLSPH